MTAAGAAAAVEIPLLELPPAAASPGGAPPAPLAAGATVTAETLARLAPLRHAAAAELAALAEWNRAGARPTRHGLSRALPAPARVAFAARRLRGAERLAGGVAAPTAGGGLRWTAEVHAAEAFRLRLHLAKVALPVGTRAWVSSADGGEVVAFRPRELATAGGLWTPSVGGPTIRLAVELPPGGAAGAAFTLDRLLEEVALDAAGAPLPGGALGRPVVLPGPCLHDPACAAPPDVPGFEAHRRAVARLAFVIDGVGYVCTGALLNDLDPATVVPYLLTAHHCLRDAEVAASVEAHFDVATPSCGGAAPALGALPRAVGATLLASGPLTDVALVRLSSLPPGRALLGSTSEVVAPATVLHRLSHPGGQPQRHSASAVIASGPTCSSWRRPRFLYSAPVLGGIATGSSGAPAVRASDGLVVGQALGICGPGSPSDGCDPANHVVDGALAASWPLLEPWLAPRGAACVSGPAALCLGRGGRFRVEARWEAGGATGAATALPLTADSGTFWFFAESNVEVIVKVLDGCALNGHFWIFAGGLTAAGVELTVTDTASGAVQRYASAAGAPFPPLQDVRAFRCR